MMGPAIQSRGGGIVPYLTCRTRVVIRFCGSGRKPTGSLTERAPPLRSEGLVKTPLILHCAALTDTVDAVETWK